MRRVIMQFEAGRFEVVHDPALVSGEALVAAVESAGEQRGTCAEFEALLSNQSAASGR